ncbi:MAG: LPP20 family lipoprotein, partial [Gammaproteobacteria bacterium]|nr:LPP20 family lipoprotein [Gammaproteobacteria bacterium]
MQSAYSASTPQWVNEESETYPHEEFVSATGSASQAELAKDRALANLMKVFELKIREDSTIRSDTQVNINDQKESVKKSSRLQQQISIQTDKVIDGARIAETWFDDEVLTYHALAVLERKQAGNNIRQEMSRLDDETETELAQSKAQKDSLRVMANLYQALENQKQRLTLQNMLKVVDLNGSGRTSLFSLADLNGRLETFLGDMKIATATDNDPLGGLEQALKSAMGNAGFPAS